jgi:plasmid maintenance system killer protein
MQISFRTNELKAAFEAEAIAVKLWGPKAGKRYAERIRFFQSAPSLLVVRQAKSLNLHVLKGGPYKGHSAVRLDEFWRLIVSITGTSVLIEEVSKHYD